jgi:hypothetical protein
MKQRIASLQILGIIALALLLLLGATWWMDSSVLMDGDPRRGWFNMVNLHHNAFHSWRFGHITQLALLFLPVETIAERSLGTIGILVIGTILLLRASGWHQPHSIIAAIGGAIPALLVLLTVGIDPLVFGATCWIPLMAVAARYVLTNPNSLLAWLLVAAVSVESSFCANQAAIIPVLYALWLSFTILKSSDQGTPVSREGYYGLWIVLLLPAVITTVISPMPFLPHYPKSAHVTTFENIEGYLKPLIGPAYPFEVIDRPSVKTLYGVTARILLALAGALILLARIRVSPLLRRVTLVSLGFAVVAALDTSLSEELAMIAPLASLSRLLPWGTTFSLTSIALGLSALGLGYIVAINNCSRSYIAATIACVALVWHGTGELYHPYLRSSGLVDNEDLARVLRTPSANLVRTLSMHDSHVADTLRTIAEYNKRPAINVRELHGEIEISPAPSTEALATARQLEREHRWSTRTGSQTGHEVLTVRFPQPVSVQGIELDPGAYLTDYPRGLDIRGGDCSRPQDTQVLFRAPLWQGPLEVTAKGVPYFAARNKVRIIFFQNTTVTCIFVHQTARAPFDWSISKVGIIQ